MSQDKPLMIPMIDQCDWCHSYYDPLSMKLVPNYSSTSVRIFLVSQAKRFLRSFPNCSSLSVCYLVDFLNVQGFVERHRCCLKSALPFLRKGQLFCREGCWGSNKSERTCVKNRNLKRFFIKAFWTAQNLWRSFLIARKGNKSGNFIKVTAQL